MARLWLLQERAAGRLSGRSICLGFLGGVALLALPVIFVGFNVIRRGQLAIQHQQFPPRGMKVIRDTRIVRGQRAITLARVQRVLGVLLIVCAMALIGLAAYAASFLL